MSELHNLMNDINEGKFVTGKQMAEAMTKAGVNTSELPPAVTLDEETLLGLQWIMDYLKNTTPEGSGTPVKAVEWLGDQMVRGWQALEGVEE